MKHTLMALALPTIFMSVLISSPATVYAQTQVFPKQNAMLLVNQFIAQQKAATSQAPAAAAFPTAAATDDLAPLGPFITRVERVEGGVPVFKKFRHTQPGVDQKIVMVALPRATKGQFSVEKYQVSVTFTALRETDSCNQTVLQGTVTEVPVREATYLTSYHMNIKAGATGITLMACDDARRTPKQVAITTDLETPRAFRDNLVFYVPKDVTVKAKIWKAATTVEAKSPEEAEAEEDFGPSELAH